MTRSSLLSLSSDSFCHLLIEGDVILSSNGLISRYIEVEGPVLIAVPCIAVLGRLG